VLVKAAETAKKAILRTITQWSESNEVVLPFHHLHLSISQFRVKTIQINLSPVQALRLLDSKKLFISLPMRLHKGETNTTEQSKGAWHRRRRLYCVVFSSRPRETKTLSAYSLLKVSKPKKSSPSYAFLVIVLLRSHLRQTNPNNEELQKARIGYKNIILA